MPDRRDRGRARPRPGIVHTDTKARDSLAFDLLEPLRPVVDRHVLRLLSGRHFTSGDFAETRDGTCRLLDPLTRELCEQMPRFGFVVGPVAEQVAHTLARTAPGKIALRTPLSRANHKAAQTPGARAGKRRAPAEARVLPTCRTCGTQLYDKGRQLCTACWPVHREALSEQNLAANRAARNASRAAGVDPLQTPEVRARRHETLLRMKAAETAWREADQVPGVTEQVLHEQVLRALVAVPLGQIQRATGLSNPACSRIRARKMTPHPRH
jgi:ribosomal protein L37E